MSRFRFTPQAADDLFQIWNYIADDSVDSANRVEEAIYDACGFLAKSPLAGRIRRDLTSQPVRFWPVQPYPNYLIIYHPDSTPLEVIRIIHGARSIPRMLL